MKSLSLSKRLTFILKNRLAKLSEEIEQVLESLPLPHDLITAEKQLRDRILATARHHMPAGWHRFFLAVLPPEAKSLVGEGDQIWLGDRLNPKQSF